MSEPKHPFNREVNINELPVNLRNQVALARAGKLTEEQAEELTMEIAVYVSMADGKPLYYPTLEEIFKGGA